MPRGTRFEQVDRYLAELREALSDRPADERADIVAAIREHIESALPDDASQNDIERELRALGDPLVIAATADDAGPPRESRPAKKPDVSARTVRGLLEPTWLPLAACVLAAVSVLLPPFGVLAVLVAVLAGMWVSLASRVEKLPGILVLGVVVVAAWWFFVSRLGVPLLIVAVGWAALWSSARWTRFEKIIGTLALPLPALAVVASLTLPGSVEVCESAGGSESASTGDDAAESIVTICTGGTPAWQGIVLTVILVLLVAAGLVATYVLHRRAAGPKVASSPAGAH